MNWYRGWYGNWNTPEGVRGIPGSFNRDEIFARAQRIANATGEVVTIEKENSNGRGLVPTYYKVTPKEG